MIKYLSGVANKTLGEHPGIYLGAAAHGGDRDPARDRAALRAHREMDIDR